MKTEKEKELIKKTVLPSGVRVITENLPYLHSVAFGIFFNHGARDESPQEQGIAHLLEHMFFKGTTKRSAKEISIFAESKGTIIDGFTSKESTGIYARFLAENFSPIAELACEIVSSPALAENELTKEKMVIAEEIKSNQEDPEDQMLNLLFRALYEPHPMGNSVTGTIETLMTFKRETLYNYYKTNYSKTNAIVVGVGEISHEELCAKIEKELVLNSSPSFNSRNKPEAKTPTYQIENRKELTQVYVAMAKPVFSFQDERRYALSVLNTALGGGVSSRLFQRLREEEGLVYTIASFVDLFFDSGVLGIYFITDYKKFSQGVTACLDEISKLRKERFTKEEFATALNLTKSSILLGLENPSSRMMRLAKNEILLNRIITIEETLAAYNRLTVDAVNELLPLVLPDNCFFMSCVGPLQEKDLEPFF
uniref:Insulinase family protein n=1 Tax=candidate division WOR-3 bacterium TaxID=2052148 RepID=A0A7C6A8T9_UNCW3